MKLGIIIIAISCVLLTAIQIRQAFFPTAAPPEVQQELKLKQPDGTEAVLVPGDCANWVVGAFPYAEYFGGDRPTPTGKQPPPGAEPFAMWSFNNGQGIYYRLCTKRFFPTPEADSPQPPGSPVRSVGVAIGEDG